MSTFAELKKLVGQYRIRRQTIFDALIVAMILQHNISDIYTDNRNDFAHFAEIEVLLWRAPAV